MKLTIKDGRDYFWQYDTGRILIIEDYDSSVKNIQFESNEEQSYAVEVQTDATTGEKYVKVPFRLLNGDYDKVVAFFYCQDSTGTYTLQRQTFRIKERQEPAGLVIDDDNILTWEQIKAEAEGYRDEAKASAEDAEESATNAQKSEDDVSNMKSSIESSKAEMEEEISQAKTDIATAKTEGVSAVKAQEIASVAVIEAHKNDVKTYAEQASASASSASTSEINAKASEEKAGTSESNAKASETNAKTSETNAKKSEDNAKASESATKTSETNAKISEEAVSEMKESVEQSKSEMESEITQAKTDIANAKTNAISAIDSKKTEGVSAVESAENTALTNIAKDKAEALEAIQAQQTASVNAVATQETTSVQSVKDSESEAISAVQAQQATSIEAVKAQESSSEAVLKAYETRVNTATAQAEQSASNASVSEVNAKTSEDNAKYWAELAEERSDTSNFYSKTEVDNKFTDAETKLKNNTAITVDTTNNRLYKLSFYGTEVATFEVPVDKFIKSVSYDESTRKLKFVFFKADETEETVYVDISSLVDTYTAGNGLAVSNNQFSVKIKSGESHLKADANGIYLDLSDKADAIHSHTKSQITDFAHNHDDWYYTEEEIDSKVSDLNTAITSEATARQNADALKQNDMSLSIVDGAINITYTTGD